MFIREIETDIETDFFARLIEWPRVDLVCGDRPIVIQRARWPSAMRRRVRVPSSRARRFKGIILRNDVDRGLAER